MTRIDELIEAQVAQDPEAVALVFDDHSISYRELNQRADNLARHLRTLGVGPDILVALFLERSFDIVIGMLAVLKAGGAYVPLDPIHPQDRLVYMLADARPLVLLTQLRLQSELPPHAAHVVIVDAFATGSTRLENAPTLTRALSDTDLAYLIYTSGSTGLPKGVAIEHRAVVNMLTSMQKRLGLGCKDRMLAITTLVFDIAVLEIFLPLTLGASVVIAGGECIRDGVALIDVIKRAGISAIQATPATLRMLLDCGWTGAPQLTVFCGGEAWDEELARELLPRCAKLWNMYGPTETTVWSAVAQVAEGAPIVIGKPIARTRLYVLDGARQLVPVGVPGELYIGGDGLARGYFNRPELTLERFVLDPFTTEAGARMYRTGDLVRRRPDGSLDFLGRLDHQVKIRGFRVELGEIEARLKQYPGVAKAVVILRHEHDRNQQLNAYFVSVADIPAVALRAHLAALLPEYMVPAAYMRLQALPLTPNGKLDRNALPVLNASAIATDTAPMEARTPVEMALARIWCALLDLNQVSVQDNFFDLGGHSLLAVRVIGEINKTMNGLLTIPDFYRDPTIEGLAVALERRRGARRGAQLLSLQTGRTGLPLFFIGAGPHEVRLAQQIGEDRSIFAIEAPIRLGWQSATADADRTAMPTIEELGGLYADVLVANAGTAPCVVVGYSFAGKLAFEATRLLQRAGGRVAFLLLIDAPAHVGEGHAGINFKRSAQWIWQHRTAGGDNGVNKIAFMAGHYLRLLIWLAGRTPTIIKNHIEKVKRFGSTTKNPSGYFDENGVPIDEMLMGELHYRAGRLWKPNQIDAAGVLFRVRFPGEETLPGYDQTKGWGKLFAKGLKVVQAAGNHMTMVGDENIGALSQQIRSCLDQNEILGTVALRVEEEIHGGVAGPLSDDVHDLEGLACETTIQLTRKVS